MTYSRLAMLAFLCVLLPAQDLNEDLLAAARKGDVAQVKLLLDKGADVNAKTSYGQTPLFFACDRGHTEVVKLLLARGADLKVRDTFYRASALAWAASKGRIEIVGLLLDKEASLAGEVLMFGAQQGNTALVKMALGKGVKKETLTEALAIANRNKRAEIVEMLKKAGAEPPPPADFQVDAETLASYAGRYMGGRGGTEFDFTLAVKDGKLSGALAGQGPLTFGAVDKTHFRALELAGINIEFTANGFILHQGGGTIEFKKVAGK